jgi:DNA-binding CsgD family transcriptional regulator
MAKSERLRLRDVRAAFRLIGECTELGADPFDWRGRLIDGLCELTGSAGAVAGESVGSFGRPDYRILHLVFGGFDAPTLRLYYSYLAAGTQHTIDTPAIRFFERHRSHTTASHEQLIRPREWRRSEVFNGHIRPMGIDDRMLSFCRLPGCDAGNGEHGIALLRALGDKPFTAHDRRLVHLMFSELRPLIGTQLMSCRGLELRALSPRLEAVRDLLLAGCSDKEIAQEGGLAQPTVREYVTAIYRRYGVRGRAQLLARFLRWKKSDRRKRRGTHRDT